MGVRFTPQDGDIIVRQDMRDGMPAYALSTTPGPEQFFLRILEDALQQARRVAQPQHVRVWLTRGHNDFTLVDDFRLGVDTVPKSGTRTSEERHRSGDRDDAKAKLETDKHHDDALR